jgi:asparagine synthase (glutamine-hydrolysing)
MSQIFGLISQQTSKSLSNKVQPLIDVMRWDTAIHIPTEGDNFIGGILFDKAHPYCKEDFFYDDKDKKIIVLISGVIYNVEEIYEKSGISNERLTIPELVLECYLKYGENFVSHLNGDFVIIIVNKKNAKTLIYRDHLGAKPIGCCLLNDSMLFSSDFLSLAKVTATAENFNELFQLQELTKNNLWDYSLTPNSQVIKVLPGHFIEYSQNGVKQAKYWFPEKIKINKKLDIQTAISELREILTDAVKIRCDTRFIAAAHLSGGLDSSVVAALTKNEFTSQESFYGLSWSPGDISSQTIEIDERTLAREICEFTGIELKLSEVSKHDLIDYCADWRGRAGYFNEFRIRKDANILGVNLIFSGWGGDEFLSCHDNGIDSDLIFNMNWIDFLKKNTLFKPKNILRILLYKVFLPLIGKGYFLTWNDPDKHHRKYLKLDKIKLGNSKNKLLSWKSRKDVHIRFIDYYHLASRMEEWAIYGDRLGIEYRYPLLDKRIIEYVIAIPSKLLYKEKRLIMKELCKGILPEKVVQYNKLSDEAHGIKFDEIIHDGFDILLADFELYKKNPYLSFINFDLLMDDIQEYKKKPRLSELPENLKLLFRVNSIQVITSNFLN